MSRDPAQLSEREKEVLRLLVRGHDAKSVARTLNLSIHTVNERLRDARQKMGVSSSREAARLLSDTETEAPKNVGYRSFGLGEAKERERKGVGREASFRPLLYFAAGACLMSFLFILTAQLALGGSLASHGQDQLAAPKVVKVHPLPGSIINAGPFLLSVTFDQPMQADSYSFVAVSRETYPECEPTPHQSTDGRSFTLRCIAAPDRQYEIWFNRPPYLNFRSRAGAGLEPYRLTFLSKAAE